MSQLVALILVARMLGREQYGALGIIQSTAGMLQVLAGFGMGLTASKFVAEHRASDSGKAGRFIGLSLAVAGGAGLAMSLLLALLAPWIATSWLGTPELAGSLRLSCGVLLFGSLLGAQTGALAGLGGFRRMAVAQSAAALLTIPLVAGGAAALGLRGAVLGLVGASALTSLLMGFALRNETRTAGISIDAAIRGEEWGVVWEFGVPALLAGIVVVPANWLCSAMLVRQPDGLSELGIYSAANQWRLAILHLPIVLGQVLTPMLSEQVGRSDAHATRKLLKTGIGVNAALTLPLVLILAAISPHVIGLYGAGFASGAPVFVVLLAAAFVMAVLAPVGNFIAATGRMWIGFATNLAWGIVAVVLTWFLLPLGAIGLAWGQLGAYLLHGAWTFAVAYWILATHERLKPARVDGGWAG